MSFKKLFLDWGMILIGVIMNAFGIYIVKARMSAIGAIQLDSLGTVAQYFFTLARSPLAVFGGILVLAAPLPYAVAVSRMQLSIAYPVSIALSYIIILPLSIIYLGESLTLNKIIGVTLILISLYLFYK